MVGDHLLFLQVSLTLLGASGLPLELFPVTVGSSHWAFSCLHKQQAAHQEPPVSLRIDGACDSAAVLTVGRVGVVGDHRDQCASRFPSMIHVSADAF